MPYRAHTACVPGSQTGTLTEADSLARFCHQQQMRIHDRLRTVLARVTKRRRQRLQATYDAMDAELRISGHTGLHAGGTRKPMME